MPQFPPTCRPSQNSNRKAIQSHSYPTSRQACSMADDAELPRALIKRIAKGKLGQLDLAAGRSDREIQVSKDALLALSESARVFINYLTATGNDICRENKRQIISVDDVLTAIEDLDFGELLPPLQESLQVFKADNKEKSKKRAEQQKKRKLEGAEAAAAAAAAANQLVADGATAMELGNDSVAQESAGQAVPATATSQGQVPASGGAANT